MATFMPARLSVCKLCGHLTSRNIVRVGREGRRYKSTKVEKAELPVWQPVIGLEIHAQIQTNAKLFSGASSTFGSPANTQVSFLDSALPGTLPVLNKRCVEAGVVTAIALNCTVNKVSRFDRKHYFYADLPAGYQITQQNHALANNGEFKYIVYGRFETDCQEKTATILQLQLEQDSGKSLHDDVGGCSLIDLNRAGCALMEIVTAPDFHNALDARSFVRDLRMLLITLGTCDGKMAEGSLRVDANISVHRPGEPLGVRSEVKNLNSLSCVKKAIDYEIMRQTAILEEGGEVINETRSFDIENGQTMPMRDKESKLDYRFMPEPNLPPLHLYDSTEHKATGSNQVVYVDQLKNDLPVLPQDIRTKLMETYGLTLFRANFLVNEGVVDMFEEFVQGKNVKKGSDFFIHSFLDILNEREIEAADSNVTTADLNILFDLYEKVELSPRSIHTIVHGLIEKQGSDVRELADRLDLWQINDDEYLTELCIQIMKDNPKQVAKCKKGKARAFNTLKEQARTLTNEKANISKVIKIFKELINEK